MAAAELIPCGLPLPDDLLAPRFLAWSRCVCKAWRDAVDSRRLLRADLLPHTLAGILLHLNVDVDYAFPPFFFRPSSSATVVSDNLEDLMDHTTRSYCFSQLRDHCNGLLLFRGHVVNPATMQRARLPPPPPPPPPPPLPHLDLYHGSFLVFDPAVSPHYEVFLIPHVPSRPLLSNWKSAEWPPSPFTLRVFSSRTNHWEERSFLRQGPPMGTLAQVHAQRQAATRFHCYSAYHRGRLYVQWSNGFVTRLDTSGDGSSTYCVVAPPVPGDPSKLPQFQIGRSENGVYCAAFDYHARLQVWYLDESHGQRHPEWVLRCDNNMEPLLPCWGCYSDDVEGPWLIRYYYYDYGGMGNNNNNNGALALALAEEERSSTNDDHDDIVSTYCQSHDDDDDWSSDFEDAPGSEYEVTCCNGHTASKSYYSQYIHDFLGFHPYKEALFLRDPFQRVFAYHFNCSKLQYVGTLILRSHMTIDTSFSYTPCWIGEFPEDN